MLKWFSKIVLLAGFTLLLYHNVVAHHHDDDDDAIEHAQHHPNDPLEHVKIDHQFYQDFQHHIHVDLAAVTLLPQVFRIPEPTVTILPKAVWLTTDEPHPPAWRTRSSVLRGPPSLVNAAV